LKKKTRFAKSTAITQIMGETCALEKGSTAMEKNTTEQCGRKERRQKGNYDLKLNAKMGKVVVGEGGCGDNNKEFTDALIVQDKIQKKGFGRREPAAN